MKQSNLLNGLAAPTAARAAFSQQKAFSQTKNAVSSNGFVDRASSVFSRSFLVVCLLAASATVHAQDAAPIRVAIVGLVHGHVKGFLGTLPKAANAKLVAIVEPDVALTKQYQEKYHLESTPTYTDIEAMLNKEKPDAVLIYTTIKDHRRVVEAAAKHHVSSMMEKPLAVSTPEDAARYPQGRAGQPRSCAREL